MYFINHSVCARGSAGSTCLLHLCTRRHSVQDKDVFPCSYSCSSKHVALRPQKRGSLLGTGGGGERVNARPRAPTQKTEEAVNRRKVSKHGA